MSSTLNDDDKLVITEIVRNEMSQFAAIIVDDLAHRIALTLESLTFIKEQVSYIPEMRRDIKDLKVDMKTVKVAIRATNDDMRRGFNW